MGNKKLIIAVILCIASLKTIIAQKHVEFYNRTGIETEMVNFVNVFVDEVAKARQESNDPKWDFIKSTLLSGTDFTTFKNECKAAIRAAYTDAEIDQVFADNSALNTQGNLVYEARPELTKKMYNIGKKFGGTLDLQIQILLGENVTRPNGNYNNFKGIDKAVFIPVNHQGINNNIYSWNQVDVSTNGLFFAFFPDYPFKSENSYETSFEILRARMNEARLREFKRVRYPQNAGVYTQFINGRLITDLNNNTIGIGRRTGTRNDPFTIHRYYYSDKPEAFSETKYRQVTEYQNNGKPANHDYKGKIKFVIIENYGLVEIKNYLEFPAKKRYFSNRKIHKMVLKSEKFPRNNFGRREIEFARFSGTYNPPACPGVKPEDKICPPGPNDEEGFFEYSTCSCKYVKHGPRVIPEYIPRLNQICEEAASTLTNPGQTFEHEFRYYEYFITASDILKYSSNSTIAQKEVGKLLLKFPDFHAKGQISIKQMHNLMKYICSINIYSKSITDAKVRSYIKN